MDKAGKAEALETYKDVFAKAGVVVATHYSGLTVAELTDLRVKLKGQGASLKVIKNRLAKIALNGKGGESAGNLFKGPVAIAYSADPVSAPKVVAEYSKGNEKLILLGALMGELIHGRQIHAAAKVGLGTWVGIVIGTVLKLGLAFAMLGLFALAWFV